MPLHRFDMLLIVWGAMTSLMLLFSFFVYGFYDPSESSIVSSGRVLLAHVILIGIAGGALGACIYIARKS